MPTLIHTKEVQVGNEKAFYERLEGKDGLKNEVFGDRVYAFTPRGDIIDLPARATPIDFAYNVHKQLL